MALGRGLEALIPSSQNNNDGVGAHIEPDNINIEEQTQTPPQEYIPISQGNVPSQPVEDKPQVQNTEVPSEASPTQTVFQIEVDKIKPNPHQPRRYFDEDALRDLSRSIQEFGVLQPLVVTKLEEESELGLSVHYELIAGERRFLASKLAGLNTVPVLIREVPQDREKLELAVIENIQREDLNPIELARSIARLQDEFNLTQREIATRLGKSRGVVANSIRLLSLPTEMQEAISSGKMNEGQARVLLSLDDSVAQQKIFQDIIRESLSVRDVDERVKRFKKSGNSEIQENNFNNPEINALKTGLEELLGTKVDFQSKGGGGKITINYYSVEELESIIDKMLKQNDNLSL